MKGLLCALGLASLTACSSTGVTSIAQQMTDQPIVIEEPVVVAQSGVGTQFYDAGEVTHSADPRLQPWQRIDKANEAAKIEPGLENYVNAVQVYPYTPGGLYQLYAAPGQVSLISLQQGEDLVSVSAGDTARWMVGDTVSGSGSEARVNIIVKPVSSGLSTNLVITTTRRAYLLELRSFRETYMAALSWRYPDDEWASNADGHSVGRPGRVLSPDKLAFRYVISGDRPDWRPVRVFDDSVKTYVEFPVTVNTAETPPLFLIGDGRKPELVNYRVKGRFYIVDRLFREAQLRIGEAPQTVVTFKRIDEEGGQL